jgi:DNA-binding transcriptional regulator YhcF (GntR family)
MASNILYVKLNAFEIPEFKENKGKEWISYGNDNNFPNLLLDMYDNAPKHRAIVDGKADLIAGKGWNANNKAISVLNSAKLIEFTQSINPSESLYELTKKISLDIELFGGFYIQVIWNNLRTDFDLYHVDFSKIRTNKTQDKFFFSNDWKAYNQSFEKTGFKEIEKFDPEKKTSGIFYYKSYRPNQGVYPLPGYVAALKYIEIEKEIANFHLNNIKNGFVGGTLISFNNGQPTLEEQKEIEKQIKNKHTGTDNAGGVVLVFSEGKDKEPSVIPLRSNDFDKAFEVLNKTVTQEIFTGHRITSGQLFGIDGESAFARNVIRDASEFFQNTYVTPKQQTLEGVINDFSNLLNIDGRLNIIPLEIIGVDYSEALIQAVIPIELLRKKVAERLGIDLNEGQKFSKELTEAEALEVFAKYGESMEGYEIIHAEAIPTNFATITITTLDKSIIDLLSADNLISNKNLAEALKVDIKTINEAIIKLTDNGMIVTVDNERNLTKKGESIKKLDSPVEEILVRYVYDKKPGIEGEKIIPTTREFCRDLINKNKQYTRDQIEAMNNELRTDVWLTRGGWYHNPKTGLTSTSCRHIWQQVLIRPKK